MRQPAKTSRFFTFGCCGAGVVGLLVLTALTSFGLTLRWIFSAKQVEEEALPYLPKE